MSNDARSPQRPWTDTNFRTQKRAASLKLVLQKQRALAVLRRLRRKPLLRITGETAEVFGVLSAALVRAGRGHAYRVQDIWLAAQAVHRDFTILTSNARDFEDIPGLRFVTLTA